MSAFLRPSDRRRGVLLLVVLSVLTLFLLLGTTYVIMASRARATARAFRDLAESQAQAATSWRPALHDAALQVIRGPSGLAASVLKGHDLLGDKYGGGQAYSVDPSLTRLAAGDQLLAVTIPTSEPPLSFCSRVIHLRDGPPGVAGTSHRIIQAAAALPREDQDQVTVFLLRPPLLAAAALGEIRNVWINGRDFAGSGFGYLPGGLGETDLTARALLPNSLLDVWTGEPSQTGGNEDYDAVDEQNMALASADGLIASFHRPAIISHWIAWYAAAKGLSAEDAAATLADLLRFSSAGPADAIDALALIRLRQAMLRPFPFDHTEDSSGNYDFTGRALNTGNLAALFGNDVDADGDGTLDSVWLDLGNEPVLMPDGTRVKPLFAIRCLDLQGRLNLNVHGSPVHLLAAPGADDRLARRRPEQPEVDDEKSYPLPLGQGFGPADVRLDMVLGRNVSQAAVAGFGSTQGSVSGMQRNVGAVFGRYGDAVGGGGMIPRPGMPEVNDFRRAITGKPVARKNWRGVRLAEDFDFWQRNENPQRTVFGGAPPDYWSRLSVGIDHRGHPLAINRLPDADLKEMVDNPYEFDPARHANPHGGVVASANAWIDQPFTPAEFEALLRPFDADNASALPQRMLAMMIAAAAGKSADFVYLRNAVTAFSWDTPQVIVGGSDAPAWDPGRHDWDLVRGLKMDLNRPFGDGIDNNNNGVVDETLEGNLPTDGSAEPDADTFAVPVLDDRGNPKGWHLTRGVAFDLIKQPGPEVATLRARQLFAYHLFQLLKSLSDFYGFLYPSPQVVEQQLNDNDPEAMRDPGSRLFAVETDDDDSTPDNRAAPPVARDEALRRGNAATAVAAQQAHTERVLAQWAVNIVDFIDADAIMTPFRYKRLSEATGPASGQATQHVVWGCEYPDLMITETLAFHDRGIADTDKDDGKKKKTKPDDPQNPDPDPDLTYDQARLPRGSLFIELYATRNSNIPNPPAELYSFEDGNWLLDVGRLAPRSDDLNTRAPVWRLSLARREGNGSHNNDPFQLLAKYPDTEWLLPHGGPEIGGDTAVLKPGPDQIAAISPNRYIWLTRSDPPSVEDAKIAGQSGFPDIDNTFRVRSGQPPLLARGGYLVIGPRVSTPLGSVAINPDPENGDTEPPQEFGVPSPQRIDLRADRVDVFPVDGGPVRQDVTTVIVAAEPPDWDDSHAGAAQSGIGLNVSEPLRGSYYPEPSVKNGETGIYDLFDPENLPDMPFDDNPAYESPLAGSAPEEGTVSNFATVILERLADPLRPHDPRTVVVVDGREEPNPDWNPYIPLDFQPIDLTVFRGESETDAGADFYFYTRQRGFGSDLEGFDIEATLTGEGTIARNANPWKPLGSLDDLQLPNVHEQPTTASSDTESQAHFKHELNQLDRDRDAEDWNEIPFHSLGWLNFSFGRRLGANEVPPEYVGSPDVPYPSITWNDRPFANAYELLLVPRTAPSRLLTNFRTLDLSAVPDAKTSGEGAYETATVHDDLFGAQTPGSHLFPLTPLTDRPIAGGRYCRNADVFGRIFEFVRVPCPFACATTAIESDGWTAGRNDPALFFKAPFNRIPLFREPGGVNLNTIPQGTPGTPTAAAYDQIGEFIWAALRGSEMLPDGSFEPPRMFPTDPPPTGGAAGLTIAEARRLSLSGVDIAMPFRSMRGTRHDLNPTKSAAANTLLPNGVVGPVVDDLDGELAPRNFTLLGDALGKNGSLFTPLLHPDERSSASDPSRDPRVHSWFAFQPMIRAASNTTVRSEAYAIWVAMGLFEVQPSPAYTWYVPDPLSGASISARVEAGTSVNNPLYPDGYQLVREYGGDTGQVTRYRAFYLYDRSVPVGYETGADNDVGSGILLERFIE